LFKLILLNDMSVKKKEEEEEVKIKKAVNMYMLQHYTPPFNPTISCECERLSILL